MHDVQIPEFLIKRAVRRRGRVEVFDSLNPAATALIVIDMQNAFVAKGAPIEVPQARSIVPNINRLAAAMRASGGAVVWVAMTLAETGPNAFPVYYENFFTSLHKRAHQDALSAGSELHRFYSELEIEPDDPVVSKNRFSAMTEGASDLEAVLRERGINTVVIAGTLTNVCCESTAREAMMRGFRVLMASDANATLSDEEHLAGLMTVFQWFGDVRATKDIVQMLELAHNKVALSDCAQHKK